MTTRSIIKKTAEALMYGGFPYSIMRHVTQGFEFFFDLKKYKQRYQPKVVFDVGASTGQTVIKWNKFFPKVEYHCFEPVARTMSILKNKTSRLRNVHYHQCALGAESVQSEIGLCDDSSLNPLVDTTKDLAAQTELVQVNTLDDVCDSAKVKYIDVLKIDTEGFDIVVLKGATNAEQKQHWFHTGGSWNEPCQQTACAAAGICGLRRSIWLCSLWNLWATPRMDG